MAWYAVQETALKLNTVSSVMLLTIRRITSPGTDSNVEGLLGGSLDPCQHILEAGGKVAYKKSRSAAFRHYTRYPDGIDEGMTLVNPNRISRENSNGDI